MHLAFSPQSFSVLRQHIVHTPSMATILAELSTVFASESSFWKCVLVFVCLMKCMCLHSCEYTHVPMCVSTCVCVCGGEKSRGQHWMFSSLALHFNFWDSISQRGVPCSASPSITSCLSFPGACLHRHWGSKLRSLGLCGKTTGWATPLLLTSFLKELEHEDDFF